MEDEVRAAAVNFLFGLAAVGGATRAGGATPRTEIVAVSVRETTLPNGGGGMIIF